MEAYLRVFVNYEKDNEARLLLTAEFDYNNAKHASIGYTPFEFNYVYHPRVFYEDDVNPCLRSKVADELTKELRNLMAAYRENLQYIQELQKQANDK